MSETPQITVPQDAVGEVDVAPATVFETYQKQLVEISTRIPEVAAKQASIEPVAAELIDSFDIQAKMFQHTNRSIIFTAITDRWSKDEQPEERAFLRNTLALLALEDSPVLAAELREDTAEQSLDEAYKQPMTGPEMATVLDTYTDRGWSERLKTAINDGLLDSTKKAMGITAENETPYHVRVLRINPDSYDHSFGLAKPIPNMDGQPPIEAALTDNEMLAGQLEELRANSRNLSNKLYGQPELPNVAMVVDLGEDGQRTICISLPMAAKMLDPSLSDARYTEYGVDGEDRAVLEEEYTHTQEDGLSFYIFGKNLEELRAAHFTGQGATLAYNESERLFEDIAREIGFDFNRLFEGKIKGGSCLEIYSEIANNLGLNGLFEILLTMPEGYRAGYSNETTKIGRCVGEVADYFERHKSTYSRASEQI